MKGRIKTYLPEKRYGFIKGDDGKDYFFHENEFRSRSHVSKLCEEAYVTFEQHATPKGYKATKCELINPADVSTYVTPHEFITSRANDVRGWEIIERGNWFLRGSSRNSPDEAKRNIINQATRISANAIVNLEYYKTTGSEDGTGRGTHYFTIHNFCGRPVTIAKKNSKGPYQAGDLSGLNQRASKLKTLLEKKTKFSKRKRNIIWLSVFALSPIPLATQPALAIPLGMIGFIFGYANDYDSWLERA